ncbi:hypothetical protein ACDY96_30440 [Rhizobium mongolense]|uniref:hypothetical protein n=1 Tax=Rhizobium mongolense TaxID=57676 RepID=UPI00355852A0
MGALQDRGRRARFHQRRRRAAPETDHAYYPTTTEAEQAGTAASTRNGRISALPAKLRPDLPTGQISWIVGNKHVGEDDSELAEDMSDRAKRAGAIDPDMVAQIVAYALACHRANQALVAHFRL